MPTPADILNSSSKRLADAGIANASNEAKWLLEAVMGESASQSESDLTTRQLATHEGYIIRRLNHEPLAHIIGEMEFWSLNFKVTRDTLIPRPDSETVVEAAIKYQKLNTAHSILDLGTGSGCLILSVVSECPGVTGVGVDQSEAAIEIALDNANRLGLTDRTGFRKSDWFSHVVGRFGMIISNPPYIRSGDMNTLMTDVKDYEPHSALDGGEDGLDAYRHITREAPEYLTTDGWLLFEVGYDQAAAVSDLMAVAGATDIEQYKDLSGVARVVAGKFNAFK